MTLPAEALAWVIDEVDHGTVVVDAEGRILHTNAVARRELGRRRLVQQVDGLLQGLDDETSERIRGAIGLAQHGQRSLLILRQGPRDLSLAFLPLGPVRDQVVPQVLVQMSRLPPGDNLAITMFARSNALSPTEESVMMALCNGLEVPDIARSHRVAESTIRSQIKSIREKTGSHSIRRLLQWLHALPPVVRAHDDRADFKHNAQASIPLICHEQPAHPRLPE